MRGVFLDTPAAAARATAAFDELGISLPLDRPARRLSVAEQQLIEIAKALVRHARIIVMDEPTAALTDREIERLFALIAKLKAQGVAFVYISHRLEELPRIADRVTVIRDGKAIETRAASAMPQDEIIRSMVGRALEAHFPELPAVAADAPVRTRGARSARATNVNGVSFDVRAGEIVGLAGLVGAGRTEIVRAIAGADVPTGGEIAVDGKPVTRAQPARGDRGRHRVHHRGSQGARARARHDGAREHDARASRRLLARAVRRPRRRGRDHRPRRSPSCTSARPRASRS